MKASKVITVSVFFIISFIGYSAEYVENSDKTSSAIAYETEKFNNDGSFGFNCSRYAFIEPDFIEYVYNNNDQNDPKTVLEFGAGLGRTLEKIYTDKRNNNQNVCYTVVELCPENRKAIKQLYKSLTFKKSDINKALIAENNGSENALIYITNSRDKKKSSFDAIVAFDLFMYLSPLEQMKILDFIHDALKENGQFFIIMNSILIEFPKNDNSYYKCPKERAEKFQENFKIAKNKDPLWPGYGFDKEFMNYNQLINKLTQRNVPPINLHDRETLTNLCKIYGLEAIKVEEYCQYNQENSSKQYLGGIYGKKGPKNKEAIQLYEAAAQRKEEEIKNIADKFAIYLDNTDLSIFTH